MGKMPEAQNFLIPPRKVAKHGYSVCYAPEHIYRQKVAVHIYIKVTLSRRHSAMVLVEQLPIP